MAASGPQWPASPPALPGQVPSGQQPAVPPTPSVEPVGSRRRLSPLLAALAAITLFAVVAAAFIVGRSFGSEEATQAPVEPIASAVPSPTPARSAPTATVEAPTAQATAVPSIDNLAPLVPADAVEPVAAAARAVASAVVLIRTEFGQGSGIIYDAQGLILTNAHVVGEAQSLQVQLASGVIVPGTVEGSDPSTDVAVVRISSDEDFGVATLAPTSTVEVGQLAVAIGSPFGLDQTVTSGVISAVGRVIQNASPTGVESVVAMIQTDAPINPGNSGGALVDRQGRVVGMNTAIRTDGSGGSIGVGFAIPSDTMKLIADRILSGESLTQGLLGVQGASAQLGAPGVRVVDVTEGSAAAEGGIAEGDLITQFNGKPIGDMLDLMAEVRLQQPDAPVEVELLRDGASIRTTVTLDQLNPSP